MKARRASQAKRPTDASLARRYENIWKQLKDIVAKTENKISRMATVVALLHHKMPHYFWTGFYFLDKGELIVGPYQGTLACPVLEKHRGVCWTGILKRQTIIVPDVHQFPGHIACDPRSNSEIVVPLFNQNQEPWAVLDIDSTLFNAFNQIDQEWLEKIVTLI
ncbi:MAG: GAF domain-containing protein [Candidatus Aminicenantes bacterium]|nr:GAF domain-containing protein [Candidatus Aminicenantes bacterium]